MITSSQVKSRLPRHPETIRMEKRRVLLSLSGRAFASEKTALDLAVVAGIAEMIAEGFQRYQVELAVTVGGSNLLSGSELANQGMDRSLADQLGMHGTVANGVALEDQLIKAGVKAQVLSTLPCGQLARPYTPRRAIEVLEKGMIIVLVGGIGAAYISSSTATALRALDIKAQELLIARREFGGIYDSPPERPDAVKEILLEYGKVAELGLAVIDEMAVAVCKKNRLPVRVFGLTEITRALSGQGHVGTLITGLPDHLGDL